MKKKVLMTIMMVAVYCMCACGKTEKERVEEAYEEAGLSEEEAKEMTDFMEEVGVISNGEDTDTPAPTDVEIQDAQAASEETSEVVEEPVFRLVEPREEIIHSRFGDAFMQIENELFYMDGSSTLRETIAKLQGCYDFPIKAMTNGSNGDLVEITENSLTSQIRNILITDESGRNGLFNILCYAEYGKMTSLMDCETYDIIPHDTIYQLNMFDAGNFCKGIYTRYDEIRNSEAYQERVKDYPVLKYLDYTKQLEEAGIEYESITGPASHDGIYFGEITEGCFNVMNADGAFVKSDDGPYNRVKVYKMYFDPATGYFTSYGIEYQGVDAQK